MTEYTNNNKFVPQAPKTYEVKYVENQNLEQVKPKLSLAAKSKVVNRNGSNYVSERTTDLVPSYGPCSYSGCSYPDKSFNVNLTFAAKVMFFGGEQTSWTIRNVEDARRLADAMSDKSTATLTNGKTADFSGGPDGELWINQTKRVSIARQLREFVRQHSEQGQEVINGISETN